MQVGPRDDDPLDDEVRTAGLQQLWIAAALLFQAGHDQAVIALPATHEQRAAINRRLLKLAWRATAVLEAAAVLTGEED